MKDSELTLDEIEIMVSLLKHSISNHNPYKPKHAKDIIKRLKIISKLNRQKEMWVKEDD